MLEKIKAMLVTVGGSPVPIIKSLNQYQPEYIYFVPSESSIVSIGEIVSTIEFKPEYSIKTIEDPNDILDCYQTIVSVCNQLKEKGFEPKQVLIDYTGGTKSMSAALALAASGRGYSFSYVGGTVRDKDGLGIVTSGNEQFYNQLDPREILKIEEKNNIVNYFNSYRFNLAIEEIEKIISVGNEEDKNLYERLKKIVEAYREWDLFNHKVLERLFNKPVSELKVIAPYLKNEQLKVFIEKCHEHSIYTQKIVNNSKNKSELSIEVVQDLIANAQRRYKECRYDDATARLYRALEMIAQLSVFREFKYTTSSFPISQIPETLKAEYLNKYPSEEGPNILKFGLFSAFKLLNEMDIKEGKIFTENEDEFREILNQRNKSILAHGNVPVNKESFEKFFKLITEKFELNDLPEFPIMPELI